MWIAWKNLFISAARWNSQGWEKAQTTGLLQRGIWDVNIHFQFFSCFQSARAKVCWEILPSFWRREILAELQPEMVTLNMIHSRKATFSWDSLLLGALPQQGTGDLSALADIFAAAPGRCIWGPRAGTKQGRGAGRAQGGFLGKPCLEDRSQGCWKGGGMCSVELKQFLPSGSWDEMCSHKCCGEKQSCIGDGF